MRFACLGDARHGLHRGDRVHADGGFAGKGDGVGAVVDCVCHIGNLCTGGAGVAHHGIEHLRGGDNRAIGAVACLDDLLLQVRNLVRGNFHAQVAAGNHYGIGNLDDLVDVFHCMGVFDLRHDADAVAAVFGKERADSGNVFATADKRCSHEVDALFDAEQQVFFVLLGHDGQGHVRAGQVQLLAFTEHAGVLHGALDVGAQNAVYGKLD